MTRRTRRTAAGAAALALAALLTACDSKGGGTAASAPATPASAPATASSATASAPASAASTTAAVSGADPSGRAAGPPTGPASAAADAVPGGCRSLLATPEVKQAVTRAYGRQAQPQLVHITPRKGDFFYGVCDGRYYAATPFDGTPGATYGEAVALQDEGAAMKYLSKGADGEWRYIASDGAPPDPRGCAAIPQIPARLAALWSDCSIAH